MSEESLEVPEADAVEQDADAAPAPGESAEDPADVPLEADPADAADQAREVSLDENEDYR